MSEDVLSGPRIDTFDQSSAIVQFLAVLLLVTLCLMLLASSVMRHLGLGDPRLFEITRVVFVYLVGVAAVAAFMRVQNIAVPGLWPMESPTYQFAMAVVAGLLAWLSGRFVYFAGWDADTMSLLRLPEATPYVPVFMFSVLVTLISLVRAVQALRRRPAVPEIV